MAHVESYLNASLGLARVGVRKMASRRRYYNSRTGVWTWAEQPLEMVINDEGRPGYYFHWWLPIDRCICLA